MVHDCASPARGPSGEALPMTSDFTTWVWMCKMGVVTSGRLAMIWFRILGPSGASHRQSLHEVHVRTCELTPSRRH